MSLLEALKEQLAEALKEIEEAPNTELEMMYKGEKIAFEYAIQLIESGVFTLETT